MVKARTNNSGRKYGVSRARRFAAKLRWNATHGKRKRLTAKRSRSFNRLRAKGKR